MPGGSGLKWIGSGDALVSDGLPMPSACRARLESESANSWHSSSVQLRPASRADSRTISSDTVFVPGWICAHNTPGKSVEVSPVAAKNEKNRRLSMALPRASRSRRTAGYLSSATVDAAWREYRLRPEAPGQQPGLELVAAHLGLLKKQVEHSGEIDMVKRLQAARQRGRAA